MKRKILFVHENFGRQGGAEENVAATARSLQAFFDVELLCYKHTGHDEESFSHCFSKIHTLDWSQEDSKLKPQVQSLLTSERPDLAYVHKCLSATVMETLVESDLPTVHMVHDHEGYCMRNYKYFPWSLEVCHKKAGPCCLIPCLASVQRDRSKGSIGIKWVSYRDKQRLIHADQRLDAFIVASDYMAKELALQGYAMERVSILPPLTPLQISPQETLTSSNRVIFAGQVIRGKGLEYLISAMSQISHPFELIVLGDGSALPACKQRAAALGISDRVRFLGFVPHEEVALYYRSANVGAVPSIWPEPFGMVGIEMMAQGLPVIAFDSGGISDWLKDGETGFLVPPLDVNALANKISLVLTDTSMASRLGSNSMRRVQSQYNYEKYIERLHDLLEGVFIGQAKSP